MHERRRRQTDSGDTALTVDHPYTNFVRNLSIDLVKLCAENYMQLEQWSYLNSMAFAFTVMTTVGEEKSTKRKVNIVF